MPITFQTTRRVEFADTDAAGIMHFAAFFIMMEQAEHELLRELGLSVVMQDSQGTISWPRVSSSCDFQGPARFEDVLNIEVQLVRLGKKSVTYGFTFTNGQQQIATGRMTSVCCRVSSDLPPLPIPIPEAIVEKLSPAAQ